LIKDSIAYKTIGNDYSLHYTPQLRPLNPMLRNWLSKKFIQK